jgi:hypothetical protein
MPQTADALTIALPALADLLEVEIASARSFAVADMLACPVERTGA